MIDANKLEKEMKNGIKAGLLIEGYEEYTHINNVDDCVDCVKYSDTFLTIPDNPTNGDIMKAMFPQINVNESSVYHESYLISFPEFGGVYILKCWWDAPYNSEKESE